MNVNVHAGKGRFFFWSKRIFFLGSTVKKGRFVFIWVKKEGSMNIIFLASLIWAFCCSRAFTCWFSFFFFYYTLSNYVAVIFVNNMTGSSTVEWETFVCVNRMF